MKFGVIIMSFFAAVWWIVGTRAAGSGSLPLYCIPVLVTAALIVAAVRNAAPEPSPEEQKRISRLVGIASGLEGLAIFAAFIVLPNVQAMDIVAPIVAIIVGLHFIPLARWFPEPLYDGSALLLIVIAAIGFSIHNVDERILCVSIGASIILWLTCLVRLLKKPLAI